MKALITGTGGQVGGALLQTRPPAWQVMGFTRQELDVCDERQVTAVIAEQRPDCILNAAAYTAVDRAEVEPGRAHAVNGWGAWVLAEAASRYKVRLLHVSTDFVFDGQSGRPYAPEAEPCPLNVYGQSKLEGEQAVLEVLGEQALVLRTAWVYAPMGRNFVNTMLHLMREKPSLDVVVDQIGSPTQALGLANTLWSLAERPRLHGICHWTDAGVASWYDFAVAIQEEAYALGRLEWLIPIHPVPSTAFPTTAARPPFSVLATWQTQEALGRSPGHWRDNLRQMLRVGACAGSS